MCRTRSVAYHYSFRSTMCVVGIKPYQTQNPPDPSVIILAHAAFFCVSPDRSRHKNVGSLLTLKAPVTTAAYGIYKYFFIV